MHQFLSLSYSPSHCLSFSLHQRGTWPFPPHQDGTWPVNPPPKRYLALSPSMNALLGAVLTRRRTSSWTKNPPQRRRAARPRWSWISGFYPCWSSRICGKAHTTWSEDWTRGRWPWGRWWPGEGGGKGGKVGRRWWWRWLVIARSKGIESKARAKGIESKAWEGGGYGRFLVARRWNMRWVERL